MLLPSIIMKFLPASKGKLPEIIWRSGELSQETMESFQLGYALDEWNQLEDYLLKKGFAAETVKSAGLIKRSENQNRFYDLFRHRIIFPIIQYNQDVVGFGGRSLGDSLPKYLNTAETDLFSKRKNLYGLSSGTRKY